MKIHSPHIRDSICSSKALVHVEVAVEVIEEDLGRRVGGREVAAGAEARGEVVEARDEGVDGERDRGVGDERVVLGGDAERGAGEVGAAADGDAGPGVQPGEQIGRAHV